MKILFYQHQYPAFGGIETVTTMLACAFAADGHGVAIVSSRSRPGTKLLDQLPKCVRVHQLPEDKFESGKNRVDLLGVLESFAPDVVMFQDSYAPIEGTLFTALGSYSGVMPKIVIVEHNMPKVPVALGEITLRDGVVRFVRRIAGRILYPVRYWKSLRHERRRRRYLYSHADKYVFLSPRYERKSNRIAGVDGGDKLASLPNPVRQVTIPPDIVTKEKEILYCGSLIPSKGVGRLIAIWSKLENRHTDWHFTIVGDGIERDGLEKQVKAFGLKSVRFEGFQRETESYYHRASILVMASSFEGWPMVLGEAMQQACPPVAYDSFASLYDIVEDGVSGRIIREFRRSDFVAALDSLMGDDALRMRLQQGAMSKAAEYALPAIVKRWYELFESIGSRDVREVGKKCESV